MLPKVQIANPCPADWNQMVGDDRVRHCSLCNLNVYNLCAITEPEALQVLQNREGRLCARIYRRADGTVLTQDCPVGVRAAWRKMTRFAAAALAMVFAGTFARGQTAQDNDRVVQMRPGETGVIVKVNDFMGAAIPGASVKLVSGNKTIVAGHTHSDGTIHFATLEPGEYRLIVALAGYRNTEKTIVVSAASINRVEAKMVLSGDAVFVGILVEPSLVNESSQLGQNVPLNSLPNASIPGPVTSARRSIK